MNTEGPISASRAARIVLIAGVVAYTGFYMAWAIWNYDHLGTFGFDLGIHDQATWLLSRGHWPFITISGTYYFGDHLSWIMFLLVPLYWIVPSAKVLLVAQSLALGLAAVPLFLVARLKLRSEWLAAAVAWVYFFNPYMGWVNTDQFHPDAFVVPLTFLAFLFAMRRRRVLFLAMVVLAMLVKEDVALLIFGVGVWVAILYDRRTGIVAAALSALWMFVNFRFILPALSGTGSLTTYVITHGDRIPFGGLGGFARTLVTKPWRVAAEFFGEGRPMYYLKVFGPLGFLPFLSPSTLAAVILPLIANGLSTFGYQHMLKYHYGALVVPGLLVAAIFGVYHGSPRVRKILVCFMLLTAVVGLYLWGPAPGSRDPASWGDYPSSYVQAVEDAAKLIPDRAVVSADLRFVTQIDHRLEIYEFPNPWYGLNWGAETPTGSPCPDAWPGWSISSSPVVWTRGRNPSSIRSRLQESSRPCSIGTTCFCWCACGRRPLGPSTRWAGSCLGWLLPDEGPRGPRASSAHHVLRRPFDDGERLLDVGQAVDLDVGEGGERHGGHDHVQFFQRVHVEYPASALGCPRTPIPAPSCRSADWSWPSRAWPR